MPTKSRSPVYPWCFIALVCCCAHPTSAQELSQEDVHAGIEAGLVFRNALTTRNAQEIETYRTSQWRQRRSVSEVQGLLNQIHAYLGSFRYAVPAATGLLTSGCQARIYGGMFDRGPARMIITVCQEGEQWLIQDFSVLPRPDIIGEHLIKNDIARQLGTEFLAADCRAGAEKDVGESFDCQALASNGKRILFKATRTGDAKLSFSDMAELSEPVAERSAEAIERAGRRILAKIIDRNAEDLHGEASLPYRATIPPDRTSSYLDTVQALGPIETTELDHVGTSESGLSTAVFDIGFVNGPNRLIEIELVPDRGTLRMSSFEVRVGSNDPAHSAFVVEAKNAMLRTSVGDHTASLSCEPAWRPSGEYRTCPATIFGREVDVQVRDGPAEDEFDLEFDDVATTVRSLIEPLESQLGWSLDDVECQDGVPLDSGSRMVQCEGTGPDSEVMLWVYVDDSGITVADARRSSRQ